MNTMNALWYIPLDAIAPLKNSMLDNLQLTDAAKKQIKDIFSSIPIGDIDKDQLVTQQELRFFQIYYQREDPSNPFLGQVIKTVLNNGSEITREDLLALIDEYLTTTITSPLVVEDFKELRRQIQENELPLLAAVKSLEEIKNRLTSVSVSPVKYLGPANGSCINQGQLGSCYLLAAIRAMTLNVVSKKILTDNVRHVGNKWIVTFPGLSETIHVSKGEFIDYISLTSYSNDPSQLIPDLAAVLEIAYSKTKARLSRGESFEDRISLGFSEEIFKAFGLNKIESFTTQDNSFKPLEGGHDIRNFLKEF